MSFAKSKVWTLLVLSLTVGCPLDDDPKMGIDPASTSDAGGKPGGNGNGQSNDGTNGSPSGETNGTDPGTNGSPDSGMSVDPVEPDSGVVSSRDSGAEMDASGGTNGDPTTGGEDVDASNGGTTGGSEPDAGTTEVDAGHDSGTEVVDAGPPPIVAPDLGGADMPDAERATLIYNLMTTQGYVDNWFPLLQSNGDRRPLLITPSHGNAVRVRQNDVARQYIDAWDDSLPLPMRMPNGSVIVKDTYKLDAVTNEMVFSGTLVMAKIDALNPTTYEGNWFYVRVTTAGVATYSNTCVGCHNGRSGKGAWPVDPMVPGDPGGKVNGVVPWDYLYIPFCYDQASPQCSAPL